MPEVNTLSILDLQLLTQHFPCEDVHVYVENDDEVCATSYGFYLWDYTNHVHRNSDLYRLPGFSPRERVALILSMRAVTIRNHVLCFSGRGGKLTQLEMITDAIRARTSVAIDGYLIPAYPSDRVFDVLMRRRCMDHGKPYPISK